VTHDEDSPIPKTATTQPEHRLPHECRARAPRFFADDDEEDIAAHIIHPQPRPHPIQVQQVQVAQVPSLACNMASGQLPGDVIANTPQPECNEACVGGETMPVANAEHGLEVQASTAVPTQPNHHQLSTEGPVTAQSGRDQAMNAKAGPLKAILSGEQSVALVGGNNVPESGLPKRHSTQLATKGK